MYERAAAPLFSRGGGESRASEPEAQRTEARQIRPPPRGLVAGGGRRSFAAREWRGGVTNRLVTVQPTRSESLRVYPLGVAPSLVAPSRSESSRPGSLRV